MKDLTKKEIEDLKAKHGEIHLVEVTDEEGVKFGCVVKTPGKRILGQAAQVAGGDPIKMNDAILRKIHIHGDNEILTRDDLTMGVAGQLDKIIKVAEATIKKL